MRLEAEKRDKSTVEENASIYKKQDERRENLKLKDLQGKEKLAYFRDYYLVKVIVAVALVAVVVGILISVLKPSPENVISAAVVENPMLNAQVAQIEKDLTEMFVKDEAKESILFDTNYYLGSTYGAYSVMKLSTMIAAGDLDIMILPRDNFQTQLNGDAVARLEDVFGSEELEKWSDLIIAATPYETDMNTGETTYYAEGNYGLSFNKYLEGLGLELDEEHSEYIFCVTSNTPHTEACRQVAHYFFDK